MTTQKPILCLDFDGVLHSYTSPWQGAGVIADPPVPGAIAFLREAVQHFTVAIYSSRSVEPQGLVAMQQWLGEWSVADRESDHEDLSWLAQIIWPTAKPPALVTIDDRALTFTGTWPAIVDLKAFQPWNRKPSDFSDKPPA